jgi:hypothetical protein
MRYRLWSFFSLANICFIAIALVLNSDTVFAAASGNNVEIVSVVAAVRYILVDNKDSIVQIQSNTQTDVLPVVYENNFNSKPIPLSPLVDAQYKKIIAKINTKNTGIVYQRHNQSNLLINLSFINSLHKYHGSLD